MGRLMLGDPAQLRYLLPGDRVCYHIPPGRGMVFAYGEVVKGGQRDTDSISIRLTEIIIDCGRDELKVGLVIEATVDEISFNPEDRKVNSMPLDPRMASDAAPETRFLMVRGKRGPFSFKARVDNLVVDTNNPTMANAHIREIVQQGRYPLLTVGQTVRVLLAELFA